MTDLNKLLELIETADTTISLARKEVERKEIAVIEAMRKRFDDEIYPAIQKMASVVKRVQSCVGYHNLPAIRFGYGADLYNIIGFEITERSINYLTKGRFCPEPHAVNHGFCMDEYTHEIDMDTLHNTCVAEMIRAWDDIEPMLLNTLDKWARRELRVHAQSINDRDRKATEALGGDWNA